MATVIINLEASVAGMLWTGSLGWLEHPADNREVAGSNPASSTFTQQRHFMMGNNINGLHRR